MYTLHVCVYTHMHVCTGKALEGHSKVFIGPKGFELCVRVTEGPTTVFLNLLQGTSFFIVSSYLYVTSTA